MNFDINRIIIFISYQLFLPSLGMHKHLNCFTRQQNVVVHMYNLGHQYIWKMWKISSACIYEYLLAHSKSIFHTDDGRNSLINGSKCIDIIQVHIVACVLELLDLQAHKPCVECQGASIWRCFFQWNFDIKLEKG